MTDVVPDRPLDELLESFSLTREEMVEVIRAALEEASVERFAPVTAHERDILREDAGLGDEGMRVLRFSRDRGADAVAAEAETRERARMVGESLSMEGAASLLDRSPSSLSRGAKDGRLVAFRVDGRVRYPRWQFHDGQPLPGLAAVVAALPASWRPRKVHAVMTAPGESLDGLSPVQWLAEAGDPGLVVDLIADLERE